MNLGSGIENRVIDREIDLRILLSSLHAKPFAISPPIEVDNSFMMGLASEDLRRRYMYPSSFIGSFGGGYASVH